MNKKVYLVSVGEYSDYHIEGVFSTKEKAEEFIKTFPDGREVEVEEKLLDEFDDIIEACKDRKVFQVEMNLVDGNTKSVEEYTGQLWAAQMVLQKKFAVVNGLIVAHVFADSKEHAVKIVAEQRTQMIVRM